MNVVLKEMPSLVSDVDIKDNPIFEWDIMQIVGL